MQVFFRISFNVFFGSCYLIIMTTITTPIAMIFIITIIYYSVGTGLAWCLFGVDLELCSVNLVLVWCFFRVVFRSVEYWIDFV